MEMKLQAVGEDVADTSEDRMDRCSYMRKCLECRMKNKREKRRYMKAKLRGLGTANWCGRIMLLIEEKGEYVLGNEEVMQEKTSMVTGFEKKGASEFIFKLKKGWVLVFGKE